MAYIIYKRSLIKSLTYFKRLLALKFQDFWSFYCCHHKLCIFDLAVTAGSCSLMRRKVLIIHSMPLLLILHCVDLHAGKAFKFCKLISSSMKGTTRQGLHQA
jgi:hypothetical protein